MDKLNIVVIIPMLEDSPCQPPLYLPYILYHLSSKSNYCHDFNGN